VQSTVNRATAYAWLGAGVMLDGGFKLILYICVGKYMDLCSPQCAVLFGQGCKFVLMRLFYC
jgi:hypothetical protein